MPTLPPLTPGPAHAVRGGLWLACLLLNAPAADAQQDKATRRLQLQLQSLQQQLQDAQAAKAAADAARAEAEKKLAAQAAELPRSQGALRKSTEALKAGEAVRAALQAQVAALEKQLADDRRQAEEGRAAQVRERSALVKAHEARQAELQARFEGQQSQVAECVDKNQRLVKLGAELIDRYRSKGLTDVLRQNDVLLGLGDVQMFNIVQNYRDQADGMRFSPAAPADKPSKP